MAGTYQPVALSGFLPQAKLTRKVRAIEWSQSKIMKSIFKIIAITAFVVTSACSKQDDFKSLPRGELFKPLSLQAHTNPTWAASGDLYERAQNPARWSPYVWASNAAALDSLAGDKARLDSTIRSLLSEMNANTVVDRDGSYSVVYRYPYVFDKYQISAPWYSAFGNASIAIGLMHIRNVTGDTSRDLVIENYLDTIIKKYSFKNKNGNTWYAEYVSPDLPDGHVSVVNGHFYVVAAMYEWKLISKSNRYDKYISMGLDTIQEELPNFIEDGYFSYAEGFKQIRDYGQQRAVNFAKASCALRDEICPIANKYEELLRTWTK